MRVPLASSVGAITGCPGIRRVEVELFDSDVGFCLSLLRSRSSRSKDGPDGISRLAMTKSHPSE